MNQGLPLIDLAWELAQERRNELAHAIQARPGPGGPIRMAMGRTLVIMGLRLIGQPADRRVRSISLHGT